MRGFLVRVGLDQAYGGGNAPVEPTSGDFVYVPIPEKLGTPFQPGLQRNYDEFTPALTAFEQRHALAPGSLALADDTAACPVHLDPDFATLTYGDQGARRGAGIATLQHGDLLVFFAGLRPVRPCEHRLLYALVGLFMVDEVVRAFDVPPERWGENAHTRKLHPGEPDIVVRAQPGVSGRLARCLPIGEWRNRAYRVRRDLLEAWGELSVRNGFIQRSAVPPSFLDATRFYDWFAAQQPRLLAENNPATVTQPRLPAEDGPQMSTTATPPRPQPTPNAEPRPAVRVEPRAEPTSPPSAPRLDAPVIVVHLRRPQPVAWESRSDPFWEFGSFGCTGCHGGNLLRPARADEVAGARLAFAQGGPQGFRLMLVTPPVEIVHHDGRCEARWPRERMPFRYDRAPLLVDNTGASDVPALLDLLEGTRRRTWEARFSSRFRTRRTPLAEGLAAQVVEAYERALRDGGEAALAQTYEQALPWPPPQVDRDRWATYCALIESVGGRAPEG